MGRATTGTAGPLTGPGLITSLRFVEILATEPGAVVEITALLKAPTYDCTSIAYWKMVDADGRLCWPDSYQLGLDVVVRVEGQRVPKSSPRLSAPGGRPSGYFHDRDN